MLRPAKMLGDVADIAAPSTCPSSALRTAGSFALEFTLHVAQVTYDSRSACSIVVRFAALAAKGGDELHNKEPGSRRDAAI